MSDRQISSRPAAAEPVLPAGRLRSLGLERNPFAGSGPLVALAGQQEPLQEIRSWIDGITTDPARPDRLAVLTAAPGMGKSRVLRELAAASLTAPLIDPGKGGLTDAQLLRGIIDAFGGTATGRTGMDLRRDIRLTLADLPEGRIPGLLIDDADYTGARLELIRNVLRDGADRGLWIVLAGQPDLADRLARRRSFRAILGPVVRIDELDASSLGEVITARIDAVPLRRNRPLIAPDAIEPMVRWAQGNPGNVLRLAEVALLMAARQGADQVDRASVALAMQQVDQSSAISPGLEDARTRAGRAIQAEIPLLSGTGAAQTSSATTQRPLWDEGASDDSTPN